MVEGNAQEILRSLRSESDRIKFLSIKYEDNTEDAVGIKNAKKRAAALKAGSNAGLSLIKKQQAIIDKAIALLEEGTANYNQLFRIKEQYKQLVNGAVTTMMSNNHKYAALAQNYKNLEKAYYDSEFKYLDLHVKLGNVPGTIYQTDQKGWDLEGFEDVDLPELFLLDPPDKDHDEI